jgi:hypothetical protein
MAAGCSAGRQGLEVGSSLLAPAGGSHHHHTGTGSPGGPACHKQPPSREVPYVVVLRVASSQSSSC